MPPADRFVPRFAAEPPQELLPYGRWAETLSQEFLAAALHIEDETGDPGELVFFPDRTWNGRTYVPVTSRTSTGVELFGVVSYVPAFEEDEEPRDFRATADWTEETVEANPEWTIDLADEVVGGWRGEGGNVAAMTVVWGVPVVSGGVVATGELADLVVDQCNLIENRFTLLAPDDYRGDTLDVRLYDSHGKQLASESLYGDDDDE